MFHLPGKRPLSLQVGLKMRHLTGSAKEFEVTFSVKDTVLLKIFSGHFRKILKMFLAQKYKILKMFGEIVISTAGPMPSPLNSEVPVYFVTLRSYENSVCVPREYLPKPDGGIYNEGAGKG